MNLSSELNSGRPLRPLSIPPKSPDPLWEDWLKLQSELGSVAPSRDMTFESFPPHHLVGFRLDRYLATRFHYFTRPQWRSLCESGKVFVNGNPVKSTYLVQLNDHVSFSGETLQEPPIPMELPVVINDQRIVIFAKPPHIPVHQCGRYLKNTVLSLAKHHGESIRFCHRLDAETSGLLLASKDLSSHRALALQFERNELHKTYLAIVFGVPGKPEWVEDVPIGDLKNSKIYVKSWGTPDGLPSRTHFRVLSSSADRQFSLLMARPHTGRTNQIRIHAAFGGHHLVGDKSYYPDESIFLDYMDHGFTLKTHQAVRFHRCLLHAWKLDFQHPEGHRCAVTVPPHHDMYLATQVLLGQSLDQILNAEASRITESSSEFRKL